MADLGPWVRVQRGAIGDLLAAQTAAPNLRCYQRDVKDGHLSVFAGFEIGSGWHLSISHRTSDDPPKPGRYPTWDEIKDARYRFLPGDISVAMYLPPPDEYINVHDTTFHLWEAAGGK